MIHPELLLLIMLANGVPLLVYNLLGPRIAVPVDFGLRLPDGEPLFGPSKTWRGLLTAVTVSAAVAASLNLTWQVGATVALWALFGDLLSSFIKRRLKMAHGTRALGLDQVPESLLPLWAVADRFALDGESILAMVVTFFVLELLLSRVLFRLNLRKHPH